MKKDVRFLPLAIAAAKEAGRIQVVHYGQPYRIEYKGAIDPVTEVDTLCEKALVGMIAGAFPDHDILTEESVFEGKGSPWKWIIDPIDGTANYIHEYPCFCVSIGLEVEGEMALGVVYNPLLAELFYAEKGGEPSSMNIASLFPGPMSWMGVFSAQVFPMTFENGVISTSAISGPLSPAALPSEGRALPSSTSVMSRQAALTGSGR